jgi:hypothetical protein
MFFVPETCIHQTRIFELEAEEAMACYVFFHFWILTGHLSNVFCAGTKGLFAWRPGKAAWPRQQPRAHDFVGLGRDRCLEPRLPTRAASKQTQRAAYNNCTRKGKCVPIKVMISYCASDEISIAIHVLVFVSSQQGLYYYSILGMHV